MRRSSRPRPLLWAGVILTALALAHLPANAAVARATGPQFLERSPLVLRERDLTATDARKEWTVEVVSAATTATVTVELTVVGGVSGALTVASPSTATVPPGGTVRFRLTPGPRPRAGTGELVLLSTAGIDRRAVTIARPWWQQLIRSDGLAVGAVAGLAILAGLAVWTWHRFRRLMRRRRLIRLSIGDGTAPLSSAQRRRADEPTTDDLLGRKVYVEQLARWAREASTPMVVGVFGEWGCGKSSLLAQIEAELRRLNGKERPTCAIVRFEPWKHQHDDRPMLSLLHALVEQLGLRERDDVWRVLKVVSETVGSVALAASPRVTVSDVRQAFERYDERNFRLRSERTRLDGYMRSLVTRALRHTGSDRLVVLIDDLDRCLPEQILSVLEALKLHLNHERCIFFLAVDRDRLVEAVAGRYREMGIDGSVNYLEKIVQVAFPMPHMSDEQAESYAGTLLSDETNDARSMLVRTLDKNPRTIKAFVNLLILQDRVARSSGISGYDVRLLAAVLLLRAKALEFYQQLARDPTLLRAVAEDVQTPADAEALARWDTSVVDLVRGLTTEDKVEIPPSVEKYIDLTANAAPVNAAPAIPQPELEPEPTPVTDTDWQRLRPLLMARVRSNWLAGLPAPQYLIDAPFLVRTDLGGAHRPTVVTAGTTGRSSEIHRVYVESGQTLLITGDPGTGKTTLLLRLASDMLDASSTDPSRPAPIPLSLTAWDGTPRLFDWIEQELRASYAVPRELLPSLLSERRIALLLDGLEELPARLRAKAAEGLDDLRSRFPGSALALTADSVALGSLGPASTMGTVVEILPLAAEQARRFLGSYLGARSDEVVPGLAAGSAPDTPLLLSMAVELAHEDHPVPVTGDDIVEAFLNSRLAGAATAAGIPTAAATRALATVASRLRTDGRMTFSSTEGLVRQAFRDAGITGGDVILLLREAVVRGVLLTVRGPDSSAERYRFVHATIADALAGAADGA